MKRTYLDNIKDMPVLTGVKSVTYQIVDRLKKRKLINALKIMRYKYIANGSFEQAKILKADIKSEKRKLKKGVIE